MVMINLKKHALLVTTIALSSIVMVACGEEEDAAAAAPIVKKEEAPKDEAAAAAEAAKQEDLSYTYNAVNRRDPFKTYFDELSQNEQQDQTNLTELQKIDLDKL